MIFGKRHYEKIAKEINKMMTERGTDILELVFFTSRLVDMFEKDNPNFDRSRFIRAVKPKDHPIEESIRDHDWWCELLKI